MTSPDDPFATPEQPGGTPPPPPQQPYGSPPPPQPGYGAPPPGYGAPPPGYGAPPPAYGQPVGQQYGEAAYSGMPELAPWGTRVVGTLIDGAIILVAQLVVSVASSQLAQLVALAIEVYFAYLVGTKGQSPGKQVMKIKVVRDADGQLIGFGMAVLRWLAHILDVLSVGIGFLWPLWDAKNQTFADKVVGTVVIRA